MWQVGLGVAWAFYLGPILTLPFLIAIATAPYGSGWKQLDPNTRFLLLGFTIVAAGLAAELFFGVHYAAPITCVILALVLVAMRHLRSQVHHGKPFGITLTRAIPVLSFLMLALRAGALPFHIPIAPMIHPSNYSAAAEDIPSYSLQTHLENSPGQHLVIVHYVPGSEDWSGWVHNDADIDQAKIVWAWDMEL